MRSIPVIGSSDRLSARLRSNASLLVGMCVPFLAAVGQRVRSGGEVMAEHRQTANGFRLGRLVLEDIPVLHELAVF